MDSAKSSSMTGQKLKGENLRLVNTSFDRSIGRLRKVRANRREQSHNRSFVSQQLCALEHKNKISVAKLAKIRKSNTQLEKDNCQFRQKQISLMVENASTQQKLKNVSKENKRLKDELEAKRNILKYAFLLREQFDNVVNAIDSVQSENVMPFEFQIPSFSNGSSTISEHIQENEVSNCISERSIEHQNKDSNCQKKADRRNTFSSGVTQRPRRILRQSITPGVNNVSENCDLEDFVNTQENGSSMEASEKDFCQMSALTEEKESSQSENEDLQFFNTNGDVKEQNLNISAISVFDSGTDHDGSGLNLNISGSSQSIISTSENSGPDLSNNSDIKITDCEQIEPNSEDCDVINISGENDNSTSCEFVDFHSSGSNSGTAVYNCSPKLSDPTERAPLIEKVDDFSKKQNQETAHASSLLTKEKKSKLKVKFANETLNKTTYDFLSCSSDSFVLDENKCIKLIKPNTVNNENSPPKRTGRRRASAAISYAEPSLKGKLRRGDRISDDSLYHGSPMKKQKKKKRPKCSQNRV